MNSPLEIESLVDLASPRQRLAVTRQNHHVNFGGIARKVLSFGQIFNGSSKVDTHASYAHAFLPNRRCFISQSLVRLKN
jgi:hypothetical protein